MPDGSLWVQGSRHDLELRGREKVRVVFEGDPLTPRYLVRASEGGGYPDTLAEWEERQARKEAGRERSRAKQAAKMDALRHTAEPVTLDTLRDETAMTLREAGESIEAAGGTIRVVDSRLVVALPRSSMHTMGKPSGAARGAARLYAAEAEVVASASKRGGEVAPSKLPDRLVLPRGALAP